MLTFVFNQFGGSKNGGGPLALFIALLCVLLINALIVEFTYNKVAPHLISNAGGDVRNFVPLTFTQGLYLSLLGHAIVS